MLTHERPADVIVLIPIYNDWEPVRLLLTKLDPHFADRPGRVLLIDDGSTVPPPPSWEHLPLRHVAGVEVLRLRRNLGHQRAIAVGLSHVAVNRPCAGVLVMDGDGEDDPADVPRLLDRSKTEGDGTVVFAARMRRAEGLSFRVGYVLYRYTHLLLTGIAVRVGNFSVIPFPALSRLVVVSDLWNHYAASVFKARLPYVTVPTHRAPRLGGESKMNFVSLVIHGLSAISVFAERVGARLLLVTAALLVVLSSALIAAVGVRLFTDLAIPGWATVAVGVLAILLVQLFTLMIMIVFVVLGARENSKVLPLRDHAPFVLEVVHVWPGRH